MNTRTSMIAAALALLTASVATHAAVAESFERMLNYQSSGLAPMRALPAEADPLVEAIVVPLRDGVQRRGAQSDPVAESFQRMLTHTPSWTAPRVPSGVDADPLTAALIEPLRELLAREAQASRHASARRSSPER